MSPGDPREALHAAGLTKNYGPVTALAGVDLAVRRGEALAVMGPSGWQVDAASCVGRDPGA
nr:hypothetical protein [Propionibacterium freudenreichii]